MNAAGKRSGLSSPSTAALGRRRVPITSVAVRETHRLISSRYSVGGTVLTRLARDPGTVALLRELDDATNDRFLGEEGLLPGIGIHELVFGVRYAHIVNAAFTHASPSGGRFNTAVRGAWYCSLTRETSLAEVAFHKLLALEEVDWANEEVSTSDDYLADLTTPLHDLRESPAVPPGRFARYLRPAPVPRCYRRPQALADRLLQRRSNGVLYPSVRDARGTCIVCFRPALVYNVRRGARLELRLRASRQFDPEDPAQVRQPTLPAV